MEKGAEVSAKYITKKCIVGKIQWKKTDSRAKYNGERRRGCGKIHYEKMHSGQNIMEKKTAFSAKYNGERRRGFGKIHYEKMHCGQNTMEKNGF